MSQAVVDSLFGVAQPDGRGAPRDARPAARAVEALRVCVLGSGSGGNCTVIRFTEPTGVRTMLVDLGFGPRTTQRRLEQVGLSLDDVDAVCLTHLDRDHFRPSWPAWLVKHRIPLHLHHWHEPDLQPIAGCDALVTAGLLRLFDGQPFALGAIRIRTARCQHDRQGTIAYRFDGPLGSFGHMTDLGHVPPTLIEHLAGVDVLAIESNYDERMTVLSPRPSFVNRRNMSDSGHLSNEQAFEAVQQIAAASAHGNPRRIVLLHRSSQCNHPTKVRRVFERCAAVSRRVVMTEQRRRTRWVAVRPLKPVQRHQWTLGF